MKQSRLWLLALLTVLTLVATPALAEEGAGHLTGSWELGMSGINTDDNAARVNEYGSVRAEDGVSLAPQLDLEFEKSGFVLEIESETMGPRDQQHELSIDAMRVFKFDSELSVLEHHKDQETLSQMGATLAPDLGGGQPSVTTDKIFADTGAAKIGGADPINGYDPATAWSQQIDNDYIVTRREWKNEAELTLPMLPNVTIKAGTRIETREGLEQAIGLSKCSSCHVSADGKDIDERTEDFTLGATGKFGIITVDYEYLNRNFNEDADAPSRYYAAVGTSSQADMLNYNGAEEEYARTPDSEKESHMIKMRADLPNNTSVTAMYVKSEIESSKSDLQNPGYTLLDGSTLESEYESFGGKIATKVGKNLRLSLRGSTYEIEADNNFITNIGKDGLGEDWASAEEREVTEFGLDGVYRLAKATTLRLGYEYEKIDREEKELGETETQTFMIALKTRLNKSVSGRISYEYQDIDEPFSGADMGINQDGIDGGSGLAYDILTASVLYWDGVYPERSLSSSSEPDAVHEMKLNTTFTFSEQMAATIFARVRYEENDDVNYEQTTYVPGVSFWYAPSDKLNLTMFYSFNRQETENQACVGWYHG